MGERSERSEKVKTVVVHRNVDLDAVACVVAVRERSPGVKIEYLRANEESLPDWATEPGVLVLDHPLGEKGELAADGRRSAAFTSLPGTEAWDPFLREEIEEQDRLGRSHHPRWSLGTIHAAIKRGLAERGLRSRDLDDAVVFHVGLVMDGLNSIHRSRLDAAEMVDRLTVVDLAGGVRLAVHPKGPSRPTLGLQLSERGVSVGVYQNGYVLGVTRYPDRDEPDLRRLRDRLPGWFVHPAGFLAAWGTSKAPVFGPPPAGTPQNQEELVLLMVEVFGGSSVTAEA